MLSWTVLKESTVPERNEHKEKSQQVYVVGEVWEIKQQNVAYFYDV